MGIQSLGHLVRHPCLGITTAKQAVNLEKGFATRRYCEIREVAECESPKNPGLLRCIAASYEWEKEYDARTYNSATASLELESQCVVVRCRRGICIGIPFGDCSNGGVTTSDALTAVRGSATVACLTLIILDSAFSQNDSPTISRTIWDSTSAVLPGAVVVTNNSDRNIGVTTVTNKAGVYLLRSLKPGSYRLSGERPR
jgi:hypothetical protein